MPKLTGIFEQFKNIDKVPPEDLAHWLKSKEQPHVIDNFIGNRIIYPQTVAVTSWDMDMDFAILHEHIKQNKQRFYHYNLPAGANPKQAAFAKKIVILEEFVKRFPPLIRLIQTYLDVLELEGVVTILLNKEVLNMTIGSIVNFSQQILAQNSVVSIDGKPTFLEKGAINIVKNTHRSAQIQIGSESPFLVSGGELGLVFDLR